jgi:Zn-dependent protease
VVENPKYPEVLVEIRRLEDRKVQWVQAALLFIISLQAFVGANADQKHWETLFWLIPILFVHESGHWVAMKIFGYRNMQMFFIPFFGAAVSGQNRTAAGWKKAIVSLAGPIPGIVLGAALAWVSIRNNIQWLRVPAMLTVLLNLFNLVPVLPLDGGRFFYATLFCRNLWLDIVFQAVAIIGLLALIKVGGGVFVFLAIFLAIGLPAALKTGRIIHRFRGESIEAPLPGDYHIPPGIADTLAGAVKEAMPRVNNRVAAQNVLNIYESLNARPPSSSATLGLMALYVGAVVLPILVFIGLIRTGPGSFSKFVKNVRTAPHNDVSSSEVQVWHGTTAGAPHFLIVTTLPAAADMSRQFQECTRILPSNAMALQFGHSIIAGLPVDGETDARKCLERFSADSQDTFMTSNEAVTVWISFDAPSVADATNIAEDLASYFRMPDVGLIPPWNPILDTTAFAPKVEARHVWNRIYNEIGRVTRDAFNDDMKKLALTADEHTAEQTNRLDAIRIRARPVRDQELRRLDAEYAGTPFAPFVQYERELIHLDLTENAARNVIFVKVAELSGRSTNDYVQDAAFGATIARAGSSVRIRTMSVTGVETNLPQIVEWLTRENCQSIKYRFGAQ